MICGLARISCIGPSAIFSPCAMTMTGSQRRPIRSMVAAEAAPYGMVASVAGLVIGAGEIFGGGIAPAIAGRIAQSSGIQNTLMFAIGGQVLGLILALLLKETAPRKVGDTLAAAPAA